MVGAAALAAAAGAALWLRRAHLHRIAADAYAVHGEPGEFAGAGAPTLPGAGGKRGGGGPGDPEARLRLLQGWPGVLLKPGASSRLREAVFGPARGSFRGPRSHRFAGGGAGGEGKFHEVLDDEDDAVRPLGGRDGSSGHGAARQFSTATGPLERTQSEFPASDFFAGGDVESAPLVDQMADAFWQGEGDPGPLTAPMQGGGGATGRASTPSSSAKRASRGLGRASAPVGPASRAWRAADAAHEHERAGLMAASSDGSSSDDSEARGVAAGSTTRVVRVAPQPQPQQQQRQQRPPPPRSAWPENRW